MNRAMTKIVYIIPFTGYIVLGAGPPSSLPDIRRERGALGESTATQPLVTGPTGTRGRTDHMAHQLCDVEE